MLDFFRICTREIEKGPNKGGLEIYPDFTVGRSKDLMVRGRAFYAIWDEKAGIWSTDEYDVQRLVDEALDAYAETKRAEGILCSVKHLRSFTTNGWTQFRKFVGNVSDNSHQLDEVLTFANTATKKTDYVSKRLQYALQAGTHAAWDELTGVLYNDDERAKIEWSIGAIISGDSKKLQKFVVLYGPGGTGKSTVLNIIQKLFDGYYTSFESKALVGNNNAFSTEVFASNPLVAIQHDGDLSKIDDNGKLNSIISHEEMTVNQKFKASYTTRFMAFLYMGTNKPVKITDAKSGIIRRLIDVHPTGERIPPNHYNSLMSQIDFELGAIAHHCLQVYREMGKNFYNTYRPLEMMLQTDVFFNFVEYHYDLFKEQNGATLRQAYSLYKEFCTETGIDWVLPQYKFREELRHYFDDFLDRTIVDGIAVRSYYSGFSAQPFKASVNDSVTTFSLVLDEDISGVFDLGYADQPAQYAKEDGSPKQRWALVRTTLAEIDTSLEHYVKVPDNLIVADFDLKDDNGEKSLERNLAAASEWPATYAELSKSGKGVHLHYLYDGDISELARSYSPEIEIKVFKGDAALRRRLSKCNNVPISTISGGLPLREKKMLQGEVIKTEKGLRDLIARNLRKEIHPGTKPSIDFIKLILDEAYAAGVPYNVTDLREAITSFAVHSTHQNLLCIKTVQQMRFQSNAEATPSAVVKDERPVFFDVEVFPNLFVICWKYEDAPEVVRMINPTPQEVEMFFALRLVGFNNRRYDNHMIYARYLGYDNAMLYALSQKIIEGGVGSMFGEAYNLSYADVYDFSSIKQSLKKFEIQLGIHHMELDLPWDQPVADKDVQRVVDYCVNDVKALEATFKSRKGDYIARQILAELSGLTVNETTAKHTAAIIFEGERNPQKQFVYTKLNEMFPGYEYDWKAGSTYRGEVTGEGGYVYAEPGMYENVALLDVASMHPTSIRLLDLFGPFTKNFADLVDARLAIKRKDYAAAKKMLGGKLAPFLGAPENTDALSYALKIVINIVYGLTSAKFDNPFRDQRNKDNIVAKRGALFMIDLKHAVQEQGFDVAHIKTDSIKIPNATPEIIQFVMDFGEKYGYTFEHETTYDAMTLVNDAVYIARYNVPVTLEGDNRDAWKNKWVAVGAQFQHPYVFKTLFTGDRVDFLDLCEAKSVTQGSIHLDFDPGAELELSRLHFVGRTGLFVPVHPGFGGGILYRIKDGKHYAVAGTKGHLWVEAEIAKDLPMEAIDMSYFENLAEEARKQIDYWGEYTRFIGK